MIMTPTEPDGTVIITGGNAGLGFQCAKHIAAAGGWHVILACRHPERAADAVRQLISETGSEEISALPLDLASLASVRRFAQAFADSGRPPLKAIVCNAGVQIVSGTCLTEDGYEATFGVNHLGHFLLVNLLLGQLEAPARVVFVSSGTHDPEKRTGLPAPRFESARSLAWPAEPAEGIAAAAGALGRQRYTNSKLCNVYCAYELSRRLQAEGLSTPRQPVTVNAFDPGMMPGSGLARDYAPWQRLAWHYLLPVLRWLMPNVHDTDRSGKSLARLVLDPELAQTTGRYFEGLNEISSSKASYDQARAAELWEVSLDLTRLRAGEAIGGRSPQ